MTVLGVAGVVAILSRVTHTDPVAAYRNGVVLIIAFFAAAGAVSAVLLTARRATTQAPAAASADPAAVPVLAAVQEPGR